MSPPLLLCFVLICLRRSCTGLTYLYYTNYHTHYRMFVAREPSAAKWQNAPSVTWRAAPPVCRRAAGAFADARCHRHFQFCFVKPAVCVCCACWSMLLLALLLRRGFYTRRRMVVSLFVCAAALLRHAAGTALAGGGGLAADHWGALLWPNEGEELRGWGRKSIVTQRAEEEENGEEGVYGRGGGSFTTVFMMIESRGIEGLWWPAQKKRIKPRRRRNRNAI